MSDIVEVVNEEVLVGTYIISLGFKREHKKVVTLVEKYEDRFLRLNNKGRLKDLIMRTTKHEKAGRPIKEYLLNEPQAAFLGSLFRNSELVLDFKEQMAREFFKMRDTLRSIATQQQSPEWLKARAQSKVIRREETDTIKDFIAYAKHQGSKNADKYYMILSKCVNDKLFEFTGEVKNKRDAMGIQHLMIVGCADGVVSKALLEGMSQSLPYKDIYKLARDRLITLAEIRGISEVTSPLLRALKEEVE